MSMVTFKLGGHGYLYGIKGNLSLIQDLQNPTKDVEKMALAEDRWVIKCRMDT